MRLLRRVHGDRYLESLQERGAMLRLIGMQVADDIHDDFLLSQRSMVGGTVLASRLVNPGAVAVNLGGGLHHATAESGQGFCAFNDVAVAIADRKASGLAGPYLVIDLDLHDGEGTRDIFSRDPSVHTFSIHNRHLGPTSAVASTSIALGDEVEDGPYLEAVRQQLPPVIHALRPEFVFYLAGTDPADDDMLGNWNISAAGLAERDRIVIGELRSLSRPASLVILLAGGYGQQAWRHSARLLGWLAQGQGAPEPPPTAEFTLARHRRVARQLRVAELTAEEVAADWSLKPEDVDPSAGAARRTRLLDYYSRHGVEMALERFGLLDRLRAKGFDRLRVELDLGDRDGQTLRVLSTDTAPEPLIELRVRRDRRTLEGHALLAVEWLLIQDPRAGFPPGQQPLPGQNHPGLGMLGDFSALLILICERLDLDGLLYTPAHYHIAALTRNYFRFLDPLDEARFRCMYAALRGLHLARASRILDQGGLLDRDTGQPVVWRPAPALLPVSRRLRERLESESYRQQVRRGLRENHFVLRDHVEAAGGSD